MSKTNLPAAAGNDREHHFAGAGKPITDGKGPVQGATPADRLRQLNEIAITQSLGRHQACV